MVMTEVKRQGGEDSDDRGKDEFVSFSEDQVQLYQRRYDEGYDLMDPQYLQWLERHHPESVPADTDNLIPAPESSVKLPIIGLRFSPACAIAQEHRLNFELGPEDRVSTGLQVS